MKTFKQHLEENRLATMAAAAAIAGGAMAAPPKPEALDILMNYTKQKEGFRPVAEPDKDARGNPIVIGYGTTHNYPDTGKHIVTGEKITREKAENLIKSSYSKMTPQLEKIPGWDDMSAGQQAGLMSFAYNTGGGFYGAKGYETISKALKNKDWDAVPDAMKLYNKANGKVLRGLVTRREQEGKWWSGGISPTTPAPAPAPAPAATATDSHTVAKGDTLGAISKKYGKSIEEIQKLNPDITDPNKISVGQKIKTK